MYVLTTSKLFFSLSVFVLKKATVEQIASYIRSIKIQGYSFTDYADIIERERIDGKAFLSLTLDSFNCIGIIDYPRRKLFHNHILRLQSQSALSSKMGNHVIQSHTNTNSITNNSANNDNKIINNINNNSNINFSTCNSKTSTNNNHIRDNAKHENQKLKCLSVHPYPHLIGRAGVGNEMKLKMLPIPIGLNRNPSLNYHPFLFHPQSQLLSHLPSPMNIKTLPLPLPFSLVPNLNILRSNSTLPLPLLMPSQVSLRIKMPQISQMSTFDLPNVCCFHVV